jgi:hypothetical protein
MVASRSGRSIAALTMFMTAGASFLACVPAPFTLLAAVLLVHFDVAETQRVETLHR